MTAGCTIHPAIKNSATLLLHLEISISAIHVLGQKTDFTVINAQNTGRLGHQIGIRQHIFSVTVEQAVVISAMVVMTKPKKAVFFTSKSPSTKKHLFQAALY
ncbi:hypothetical protein [Curvibacter gracilis]|uniref:hypothetical protein n=1 Tax=Curvibacter gracilis TaxID=230310 RepID=UPI0012F8FC61|nr:hypothetical protein [Curvibacter gracilis]